MFVIQLEGSQHLMQFGKDQLAQQVYAIFVGQHVQPGLFEKHRGEVLPGSGIFRWCES
ncbi:hypothetical protein RJZ90_006913 [Blastomyces dermatitidis]